MNAPSAIARVWLGRACRAGFACAIAGFAHVAAAAPPAATAAHSRLESGRMLIVAIAEKPDPAPSVGSTPRGYAGLPNYQGSARSLAGATALARDYELREVSAWTINPLRLRCMLYRIPASADRDELLTRLRHDERVRLAQPLQEFETLSAPPSAAPPPGATTNAASGSAYNDPYIGLQRGFSAIGADQAQRWSSGAGVRVAVIDAGIDAAHPDLHGRIAVQRDFVDDPATPAANDRHGTEVAGVIAAVANNRVGIAGIAPDARLYAYRACWSAQAGAAAARCNSFTLALALGAAIDADAQIVNLSLGGPSDPLLEQLARYAVRSGMILVGAVPPDGRLDGFPLDVPGVIAVDDADRGRHGTAVLAAPGRDILTLEPGGSYDYASGSSLAAAHVSGALALLLQLDSRLHAREAFGLLDRAAAGAAIDVCAAASTLRRSHDACHRTPLATAARVGLQGR